MFSPGHASNDKIGIIASVLMCHAPIVLPEIAKEELSLVESTTKAMLKAAEYIKQKNADLIVLVSPHAPRHKSEFGFYAGEVVFGSFEKFGFPQLQFKFKNASDKIQKKLISSHLHPVQTKLDHGSLVPLYFIHQVGCNTPVLVLSLPYEPNHYSNENLGQMIQEMAQAENERWIILGSGDMSHRLQPGAPAGYHPQAKLFDQFFVEHLKKKNYFQLTHNIDQDLRATAAEDMLDSAEIAMSALKYQVLQPEVLSYEAPFGVGYLVATL